MKKSRNLLKILLLFLLSTTQLLAQTAPCATTVASFAVSNQNPQIGETVWFYNQSTGADSLWWVINSTDTLYSREVGMDSIPHTINTLPTEVELIAFGVNCNSTQSLVITNVQLDLFECPVPANCDELCNLVCNGNFECLRADVDIPHTTSGAFIEFHHYAISTGYGIIHHSNSTPDLYHNVSTPPPATLSGSSGFNCNNGPIAVADLANNTVFAGIGVLENQTGEPLHFPLKQALDPNRTYRMSMRVATLCEPHDIFVTLCENAPFMDNDVTTFEVNDITVPLAMVSPPHTTFDANDMLVLGITNPTPSFSSAFSLNAKDMLLFDAAMYTASNPGPDNLNWQTISRDFSPYYGDLDNIIIHLRPFTDQLAISPFIYVYFDDIKIEDVTPTDYTFTAFDITVCEGATTASIPCTLDVASIPPVPVTASFTVTMPSGNTTIYGTYTINQGQNIINLPVSLPASSSSYSISITANIAVGNICYPAPAAQTEIVNVNVLPLVPLTLSQTITGSVVGGFRVITVTQQVCAPGATSNIGGVLLAHTPAGWTRTFPTPSGTNTNIQPFNLTAANGFCRTFTYTYRIPVSVSICGMGLQFCGAASPTANTTCFGLVEKCTTIPTNTIGLPTAIPDGMSFSQAMATVPALLQPSGTPGQNVIFMGNHVQDITYDFVNSQIRMGAGAQITVLPNRVLRLTNTNVSAGCGQLWRSITVRTDAILESANSTIADGLYAIEAIGKANLYISNTNFNRNYVGIYIPPAPTNPNSVFFGNLSNNTFEHTGPNLLPVSAWITPPSVTLDKRAYAGILMYNQVLFSVVIIGNATNYFQNMTNGIVAYDSDIKISKTPMQFINMASTNYTNLPRGNGIYANGTNGLHSAEIAGFGNQTTSTIAFSNCLIGVNSIRMNLHLSAARMTAIRESGVRISSSKERTIRVENNRIVSQQVGVNFLLNNPTKSTNIQGNHITVNGTANTPAFAGIAINGGAVPDPINVASNTIIQQRAYYGIYAQAANSIYPTLPNVPSIKENSITMNPLTGNTTRIGIYISGSSELFTRCNQVNYPNSNPSLPIREYGMYITHSPNGIHACNQLDNTDVGLLIDGDCMGSINTGIGGTEFGNHYIGLLYTNNNTKTGNQHRTGNTWGGSYGFRAAVHLGGILDWQQSRYYVNNSSNSNHYPPSIIPNFPITPTTQGWFVEEQGSTFDCVSQSVCSGNLLLAVPQLRNVDTTTALNNTNNTPPTWSMRRMLYEKIDKNPQWRNGIFDQFYNQQSNQPLSETYLVDEMRQSAVTADVNALFVLEQHNSQIQTFQDSILLLDSVQQTQPDTAYFTRRGTLIQQLIQQQQNANIHNDLMHNMVVNNSQNALSQNASISSNFIVEQNEKLYNQLYLQTAAINNEHFTPAQKQQLESLVYQCPHQGGSVIYKARALYQLIETKYFEDNCNQQQARVAQDSVVCYDTVRFVNPSFEDNLQIQTPPQGWTTCKYSPDTQGYTQGFLPHASEGNTYLGMVAIDNNFIESVSQKLVDTLKAGTIYGFLVDVVHISPQVGNISHASIWLGDSLCGKQQQIHYAVPTDTIWQTDTVRFTANENYTHIYITAEYYQPSGGIFIDNLRPLPFACDTFVVNTSAIVSQIVEQTQDVELHIYPNPNSIGILNIEWQEIESADRLTIVNTLGEVVGEYPVPNGEEVQQVDITSLNSGYYTVLLQYGQRTLTRAKLVVLK